MPDRVVLCMKWGSLYSAEYVNVLASAVSEHLTEPYRFVCLTDDPKGLGDGIEVYPIPDIGLSQEHWYDGAWPKVALLGHDLHGLTCRGLGCQLQAPPAQAPDGGPGAAAAHTPARRALHHLPRPAPPHRPGARWPLGRFRRAGTGPVDWMRDYWLRHGGTA